MKVAATSGDEVNKLILEIKLFHLVYTSNKYNLIFISLAIHKSIFLFPLNNIFRCFGTKFYIFMRLNASISKEKQWIWFIFSNWNIKVKTRRVQAIRHRNCQYRLTKATIPTILNIFPAKCLIATFWFYYLK